MASGDATPFPVKNQAFRVTFADVTAEATEVATSSGMYYLDLTATEMNADTVSIIVKTTSSGANTTPIVLYPQTNGNDRKVDVTHWKQNMILTTV